MKLYFSKYQGTGNDFILINEYSGEERLFTTDQIKSLCDRRFGIGADGLICLQQSEKYDFKMKYYNSDGNESTMCGNGGRCIVAFAKHLKYISNSCVFEAIDGPHKARIDGTEVSLEMKSVDNFQKIDGDLVVDTGSPHYVRLIDSVDELDIVKEARSIRYSESFCEEGINVNFIEKKDSGIAIRTYERGVEGETLSCGTGVTAAALVSDYLDLIDVGGMVKIITQGGRLSVKYKKTQIGVYTDIWLIGPATKVFDGEIEL